MVKSVWTEDDEISRGQNETEVESNEFGSVAEPSGQMSGSAFQIIPLWIHVAFVSCSHFVVAPI